MLRRNAISLGLVDRNLTTIAIAQIIVLVLIALPLAGCGADGSDGPAISSLSTPSGAQSGDDASSDSNLTTTGSPDGEHPTATSTEHETAEHATAHEAEDVDPAASLAEPAEREEDPTISVTSTPTGATAQLTWDASHDPTVSNYFVYYGKQSSGEPGSCSYESSQSVETPPATISGLDPNTPYFFAISAFGESESPCSSEVLVVTPPAHG
ncbi:MAG: fibronectin type III domain-containing protein [Nitrospira sp.]|nr:fibronectin type III domain-containing protein [Nitrospira sp.]